MKNKFTRIIRMLILTIILAGSMVLSYLHTTVGSSIPSVHAICPLGGLENFWAWMTGHASLQKLFSGTMTLFFMTIIFALIFGRAFCGNICLLGFLQEIVGKITKKKLMIPAKVDHVLRYVKYLILGLITVTAWIFATLWISPYDPWVAFSHIWSGEELFQENLIGFIILIVVLGMSAFVDRFYCKYICPAGALYGMMGKISIFKIKRNTCVSCDACSKACPMNIEVSKQSVISSAECIACGKCVSACPSNTAVLSVTIGKRKVKPVAFVLLSIAIFFGSILILDQVGLMRVTVPSVEQVKEEGDYLKFVDLRGSMTIEEGAYYVGMELIAFYQRMEIPTEVPKETLFKEITDYVPGYDFHSMKAK